MAHRVDSRLSQIHVCAFILPFRYFLCSDATYPNMTLWAHSGSSLTTLGKGNSNFTLASRSWGETPAGAARERRWELEVWTHLLTHSGWVYFRGANTRPFSLLLLSVPEGAGRLIPRMMYRTISWGVRLEWHLKKQTNKKNVTMWVPCQQGVRQQFSDRITGSRGATSSVWSGRAATLM